MIETFHLDIDGGVGERRTTPATSSIAVQEAAAEKSAAHDHVGHDHTHESRVVIETEPQARAGSESATPKPLEEGQPTAKKPDIKRKAKKRVGFQVDRPDIFDF